MGESWQGYSVLCVRWPLHCRISFANGKLTIIPRARVGYEMIDSQRGATRLVGYNQLISNKRKWNNCFIKNNQQILLDLTDFAVQE